MIQETQVAIILIITNDWSNANDYLLHPYWRQFTSFLSTNPFLLFDVFTELFAPDCQVTT